MSDAATQSAEASSSPALTPEEQLAALEGRLFKLNLFTWLFIPVSFLSLLGVLMLSAVLLSSVTPLTKKTPLYRYKLAALEVHKAAKAQEERLNELNAWFKRDDINMTLGKVGNNLAIPMESEKDLIALGEDYRAAVFNIASNIEGSGEWHRVFRERLREHLENSQNRIDQLKKIQAH